MANPQQHSDAVSLRARRDVIIMKRAYRFNSIWLKIVLQVL